MEVKYRFYEPNQGLEEIQGKIYSQANNRIVTGKEIQERFEREKIDPKTVRYAFTKDNKPLAYIQARDYENVGEVHIGRVWAMPECPEEIKTTMFDDLLTYMKGRKSDLRLKFNTTGDPEQIKFAEERGFKLDQKVIRFTIDRESIAKFDTSKLNYSLRRATMDDFEEIKKCYLKALGHVGRTVNEQLANFFKTQIETGFMSLAFEGEEMIGVIGCRVPDLTTDKDRPKNLGIQPLFTLLKKENALPVLMNAALEIAAQEKWNQDVIQIGFTDENPDEMEIMHAIAKETAVTGMQFVQ
ncbi:hypothetical protein NEF87_000506 [Candidatus Lokiarchaeum ossiferum]|uniref:N-acetyltransferase domain-containing protein n=1 Tax=Candidatus Lokiarchaeum ossiferum TaxID=2951803 RepID=A0ABY6HNV0_9ARCH|nr:hypothetical protein NEF87_000506 [Candidatus Lokiarchaeum sp. B-35]